MSLVLSDVAEIQAGHSFRNALPHAGAGNAFVLQLRDLRPNGEIEWAGLVRTEAEASMRTHWLAAGDIVFVARGARSHAVFLAEVPRLTVCSAQFFRIRVKNSALMRPDFLAWQLNRAPAQSYLSHNAEGSLQLSIRRSVLEALPVCYPSVEQQLAAMLMEQAATREALECSALVDSRQRQLDALAESLFHKP